MTNVITRIATPPAWYPDPADSSQLRYWNGLDWTDQTALKPAVAAIAEPTVADEPNFLYEPMESALHRNSQHKNVDYGRAHRRAASSRSDAFQVRSSTLAAWAYVMVPLLAVPFLIDGPAFDSSDASSVARAGLLGLMVLALGILASVDHSLLRRRGILNAPSGLVGIIPVAFVIDRTARVGRSGVAIVVVSLVVQAIVAALAIWRIAEILA